MDRRRFLKGVGAVAVGLAAQRFPGAPLAAAQSSTRLALVGDVGTGDAVSRAVAEAVGGSGAFDGLVLLGDNVYPDGDPRLLDQTVFGPYGEVLRRARLCALLGNHDVKDGNANGQVRALGMPGRWYSRSFGDLLLVCLDTNRVSSAQQRSWLESTLRGAGQRWRVVAMHAPAYSAGKHGSNQQVRSTWGPLFEEHGVQLVVAGHDHNYQVSRPQAGSPTSSPVVAAAISTGPGAPRSRPSWPWSTTSSSSKPAGAASATTPSIATAADSTAARSQVDPSAGNSEPDEPETARSAHTSVGDTFHRFDIESVERVTGRMVGRSGR